jgi:hypothetical protein
VVVLFFRNMHDFINKCHNQFVSIEVVCLGQFIPYFFPIALFHQCHFGTKLVN